VVFRGINKGKKNNVIVKAVAIAGMEAASNALHGLNVECYCPVWLKKGISERFDGVELQQYTDNMKELEENLLHKFNGLYLPSFGYKKSEALFCLEGHNVPNNVFPIFWWPILKDKSRRTTIFNRLR
jgi:hypothetical protein